MLIHEIVTLFIQITPQGFTLRLELVLLDRALLLQTLNLLLLLKLLEAVEIALLVFDDLQKQNAQFHEMQYIVEG